MLRLTVVALSLCGGCFISSSTATKWLGAALFLVVLGGIMVVLLYLSLLSHGKIVAMKGPYFLLFLISLRVSAYSSEFLRLPTTLASSSMFGSFSWPIVSVLVFFLLTFARASVDMLRGT